jgi:transcriptional regulator with XRE-family HTH domain
MITGEQVKAARELLGWSLPRLASRAAVSDATIRKWESGGHRPANTVSIQHALEAAGVEFTNGNKPGVRPKAR